MIDFTVVKEGEMEPEILTILKAHGLSQKDIATAMSVRESTVSQWASRVRTMAPGIEEDLRELASLIEEHVRQGGVVWEVLSRWRPTTLITPAGQAGRREQVTHSGGFDIPPDLTEAYVAAMERQDMVAATRILLQAALRQIAPLAAQDVSQLTAVELARLRRALRSAEGLLSRHQLARSLGLEPPRGEEG
jgi:transcriptional regulator with XRE-family HTH domain